MPPQHEKPKSGSLIVYFGQGPTNAGQVEASSSLNELEAEISQQDADSEEAAGTETTLKQRYYDKDLKRRFLKTSNYRREYKSTSHIYRHEAKLRGRSENG